MKKRNLLKKIITPLVIGSVLFGGVSSATSNNKERNNLYNNPVQINQVISNKDIYPKIIQEKIEELSIPKYKSLEDKFNIEEDKKALEIISERRTEGVRQAIYHQTEKLVKNKHNERIGKKTSFVCARFVTRILSNTLKENGIDSPRYLTGRYDGVKNLANYLNEREDFLKIDDYRHLQKGDIVILDDPSIKRKGKYDHVGIFSSYGNDKRFLEIYGEPGRKHSAKLQKYTLEKRGWKFTEAYRYSEPKKEKAELKENSPFETVFENSTKQRI